MVAVSSSFLPLSLPSASGTVSLSRRNPLTRVPFLLFYSEVGWCDRVSFSSSFLTAGGLFTSSFLIRGYSGDPCPPQGIPEPTLYSSSPRCAAALALVRTPLLANFFCSLPDACHPTMTSFLTSNSKPPAPVHAPQPCF